MKAIINVNKNSSYSHLNGLTFEVKDFLTKIVSMNVDGTTTDFGYKELFIVDLKNEYENAANDYIQNGIINRKGTGKWFNKLTNYIVQNKIKIKLKMIY